MNIILTGSTGFIGKSVLNKLSCSSNNVITVGRSKTCDYIIDLSLPNCSQKLSQLPDFDVFIHLAACVDLNMTNNVRDNAINVLSTSVISKFVHQRGAYLVFASTIAVFGSRYSLINDNTTPFPDSLYGESKLLAEKHIAKSKVSSTILRICGVYGRNGPDHLGLNCAISNVLHNKPPIIYGNGSGMRNYIFVEDLADLICETVLSPKLGTYCVAGKDILSFQNMVKAVCSRSRSSDGLKFISCDGSSTNSVVVEAIPSFIGRSSFDEALDSIFRLNS